MQTRDDDLHDLPARTSPGRTLSTEQLEAVIRRAVELQSEGAGRSEEGVSEAEAVRIGRELGLDPSAVRRAVAEVRARPPEERGALAAAMGPAVARASRLIRRPAGDTAEQLERYLQDTEVMVTQRRFPDRTRYVRDSGFAAGMTRLARDLSRGPKALDLKQVDVTVSAVDEESCMVEVSSDLAGARAGHAGGAVAIGGSLATGLSVSIWATPVADPLMLLGIPVLAGAWAGMRAIFGAVRRSAEEKLETLLDRVEHEDL
jgi:hypothetical protein